MDTEAHDKPPLERVKESAGGPVGLSRKLQDIGVVITPQAISQWKQVPAERVVEIERATGIPRHVQRPDLHLSPEAAAS